MKIPAIVAAIALALVPAAAAGPVRIAGVDTGRYPDLRVTVVTPPGSPAPTIRENGAPVAAVDAINLGRAKSVVLCVDRSQSMTGKSLRDAVAAARAFVASKAPTDRIEVIAFGRTAFPLTTFSSSTADADAALRQLGPDPRSGTALWDAVTLAAHRLAKESQPGHVIIVLTDGQDVSSKATLDRAIVAAHKARASVYTIGIAGRGYTPDPLRDLSSHTGGTYHEASSTSQLAGVYASIGKTLSHTWEVQYLTAGRPGDRLSISAAVARAGRSSTTVELAGSSGVEATAPSGVLPRGVWASPAMVMVICIAVGVLTLLAFAFVATARQGRWVRSRITPHLGQTRSVTAARRVRDRRSAMRKVFATTERALANVRQFRSLRRLLERADLPLRAAELLYICLGAGIFMGLIGAVVIASPIPILMCMGLGFAIPILFVRFKASSRLKAFDNQLPDLLITVSASLKAGHSFRHAIQSVVEEGAQPSAKEFTRVLSEAKLGRPIDEALIDMAERVGSKNLSFVMTAVTIQRQVGGSLAGLFDMVAETVRQRQQFSRKVKGLTAMGRMSAYVLIALPFFLALAITVMNPKYMSPLYHTSTGHMLMLVGAVMIGIGSTILKRMVAFAG
jgi:tight adherence protein B